MRPFRAPREARKISKGTSVTCQADVATQEATPDLLQASSQEETALETVRKNLMIAMPVTTVKRIQMTGVRKKIIGL